LNLVTRLKDGTVKHRNFFTGEEAWAIPGRERRPSGQEDQRVPEPVCNFCPERHRYTPPEKSRLVLEGGSYVEQRGLTPEEALDRPAEFRRIANLFEILSLDYWRKNHGFKPPKEVLDRQAEYLDDAAGRAHVENVLRLRLGRDPDAAELRERSLPFFAGSHELIVARRHCVEGKPCSSGDLSEAEHRAYIRFAFEAILEIKRLNPHVAHVTLFQNWLKPAGASFDHLHKQLVGADTDPKKHDPSLFDRYLAQAEKEGLVIASGDRAAVVADTGRAHPSVMVMALDPSIRPEELSDAVRACHAAWDRSLPSNEEWHHDPAGSMPVHVVIKWRMNIPAGFEGASSIHINPMDPHSVREATVTGLRSLSLLGY
jgi:galactose-1-phosphate uridylyltransferase